MATSDAVVTWADSEILRSDCPSQELIDLSLDGPEACLRQSEYVFASRPLQLTFEQEFGLRGMFLDAASMAEVNAFVSWASRRCMGEDLTSPVVGFGYELDHLICDCDDHSAAVAAAQARTNSLALECSSTANELLRHAPTLELLRSPKIVYA
jgi:hypothetical protein